jgi:dissimilatory sulfite reductase (desulfoviridin) alpha/beta subunit
MQDDLITDELVVMVRDIVSGCPAGCPRGSTYTPQLATMDSVRAALTPALPLIRARVVEECAKVAENASYSHEIAWWLAATKKEVAADACHQCAAAIRAMGGDK